MNAGLMDSHIHLTDFEPGTNIAAIIEQALSAGVTSFACNGTCEKDWPSVLELAEASKAVLPFVGLHPWFIKSRSADWLSTLESLVSANSCGIGETGLDKLALPFNAADQEEAFRAQLELAHRYERPITIHCVRAWGWLTDILKSQANLPKYVLIHAYGGSPDMVKPLTDLGAYFSFSGKVLDEAHERARKSIHAVPLDRLLIETDAPNMLPPAAYCVEIIKTSHGKDHNHPANLPAILSGVAEMLNIPSETLRERLWVNARQFFGQMLD